MQFHVIEKHPQSGVRERYRTDFTYDESVQKADAPTCPVCGALVGMLVAVPPIRVHLETWGADFGDFAFWMNSFLVSAHCRERFESSMLRGLGSFEKVEVISHRAHGESKGAAPEYFMVQPKIGGRIDPQASGVEWSDGRRPTCDYCLSGGGCLERWHRVVVDEGTWVGDDLFYAYGLPGSLLVSARFVDWSIKHDFKNLWTTPGSECSHDFYPWKKRPNSEHSASP